MTDTVKQEHPIWAARKAEGLAREKVTPLLDPPVSVKTLERWERGVSPVPGWRVRQLAAIYRVRLKDLQVARLADRERVA